MDLETAQTATTTKLPILKQGEYDMWRLKIEQYFQVQEYALWDVIRMEKKLIKPVAQQQQMLHGPQLHYYQSKDAKTLFAGIQTRFGGNDATKKTEKTLLKHMYENFSALSTESLDSIFNRLQKIRLKKLQAQAQVLKIWLLCHTHPLASTNEVNTAYGVSTANTQVSPASTQVSTGNTQVSIANLSDDTVYAFLASQPNGSQLVYEDLEQIHEDDIEEMDLKWQLALLSMRTRRFFLKTGRKITINGSDIAGYDKSKVECFNYHKMGYFSREC
ncbi:hypothetical protein Tco_0170241 [Tanacetum coccineum]